MAMLINDHAPPDPDTFLGSALCPQLGPKQASRASWSWQVDRFAERFGWAVTERLWTLYLGDAEKFLMARETGDGIADSCPMPIRSIAALALASHCKAIVLLHNHPSGDARPSRADVDQTRALARALLPLDIAVADHIIIAQHHQFSFRAAGLL
jgi:DNA repair protein RadC